MKSRANVGSIAALILALTVLVLSSTAQAAVGRTVGRYAVSPTGAATYTISIWAPRGPNGLQPSMSLAYNSQSGAGPLGMGWSLAGLSSIYRCAQTYVQDPAPAPITLTSSDVFCMDGQRLRLTGGTYGTPGSTYQTEVANFANVTAYGSAGNGPAYFEVQGRDGRTYEYGAAGGSQVLATGTSTAWVWWLDKITDRAGNTMTISYSNSNGTAVPATISWTPNSYGSTTYDYTMQFAYGSNVAQSSTYGFVAGTPFSNTNLLSSISVNYEGTTVKKYVLSYQQSPTTGRDDLEQVQECADAAQTNCLAPTTIAYQSGSAGVSATSTTLNLDGTTSWYLAGYDVNGDGYKDLVYQLGTTWYVAFGSAGGYGTPINTGISTATYVRGRATVLVGDLLGSGKDGIFADNSGTWYYYTWNGSAFVGTSTGVPYDTAASAFALADTNGDGLPDLVSLDLNVGNTSADVYVRLNTSSGGTVGFGGANNAWISPPAPGMTISNGDLRGVDYQHAVPVRRMDFNGDARDDLVVRIQWYDGADKIHASNAYQLMAQGTTFAAIFYQTPAAYYLNWNDDACTDSIAGSELILSACNGQPGSTVALGETPIAVIDWDGSGRESFLYDSGGYLYVQPSTGNGLGTSFSTGIAYSSTASYMGGDLNGDGLDDLLTWAQGGSTLTYNLHNGGGQSPDLLSSVTDGYGNSAKPTYVSMVQSVNSNYFEWNDAQYPYENYLAPLYIVSQTTFSDPSNPPNGTYQQYDFYAGAWANLQGRGFSGFGNVQVHDTRNGIWETFGYGRAFPYTGILNADLQAQDNTPSETIFNREYVLSDTVLDGTQYDERYYPYVSSSTEEDYEVGGAENGALIASENANYSYDDYGNLVSSTRTVTDDDSESPYMGDSWTTSVTNTPYVSTGEWCLNLLTESQVSYSASNGSASVTRTRQYSPDATNCRYTQIVTEPSSNSYRVTEALGYDSFGNIDNDTITGVGMPARQTIASWGSTGQFPMAITDATGATTQLGYDFRYGLVSSKADPNGVTTSWTYGDGFGRLTQETRPDGTYTSYVYNNCEAIGGCLMGANTLGLSHYVYNTDGTVETDGTTYYDELGRPIVWNKRMLAASTYDRNEVRYDSLGRVVERAAPCEWNEISSPCPYWTTMRYDILDRLTEVQRPVSQNDSTLQATTYVYQGRTTTITDPNGHSKTLVRDVNGWLREAKDALGYATTFGYDAAGSKTSVTDSLGNTLWTGTYAYGIEGFLVGEDDADRGTWGYSVDALGERTAWTDPKGQHFYETYDALSRPLTRTEPDVFTQWTWGSDAASHNVGKLQSICTGSGSSCSSSNYSETDVYDSLARLYQRAIAIPSVGTYTYTWQYNTTTGFLDTLTYPGVPSGAAPAEAPLVGRVPTVALQLKYGYEAGILDSITDLVDYPNVIVWQANANNPAGQITQATLGNGLVTSRAFDSVTHWLASVESGPGGGASVQNESFLYDELGNVTQRQDNDVGLTENFYYDDDYRLSYSTLNGSQNLSLSYDPMGNITSRSDVAGGAAWTYDPIHLHQVTRAGSGAYQYVYDANGNMTSRQGGAITWSSYNYPNLISDVATGESVSFAYGPDRHPWQEVTQGPQGTEQTYHVGGLLDVVVSGSTTNYRDYIYAGNEPVAIDSRNTSGVDSLHYLLLDQEGSVAAITDSTGKSVVGESFTAYGDRRSPTTWSGAPSSGDLTTIAGITRHGYGFQEALGSMGLNEMIGRVQDAITGRFLSADPTDPDPTNPQSYNLYTYVDNNPLTATDPTGFQDEAHKTEKIAPEFGFGSGSASGGSSGGGSCSEFVGTQAEITITANREADDGTSGMSPAGPGADPVIGSPTGGSPLANFSADVPSAWLSSLGSFGQIGGNRAGMRDPHGSAAGGSGAASGRQGPEVGATGATSGHGSGGTAISIPQICNNPACLSSGGGFTYPDDQPLIGSLIGFDDIFDILQGKLLEAIGCRSSSCKVLAGIGITVAVPEAEEAGAGIDANKLNHIFGKAGHNMGGVLREFGSREAAFQAIDKAVIAELGTGGVGFFSVDINLGGAIVTVTGKFVDGVPRIGTAFVR